MIKRIKHIILSDVSVNNEHSHFTAIMRLFDNKQPLTIIQSDQGTHPDQRGWLDSH